jgi:hypothetical protein
LIEHDHAFFPRVRHGHTEGRCEALSRHWGDKDYAQMLVQLRRRYDDARPRFLNLASDGWVKSNEPNLTAFHHSSSASAAFANSPIRSSSSP